MPAECVVWICLAALTGLGVGAYVSFKLVRRHDRLNLSSTQHRAAGIISQATKEAENVRKEAELKAKDELFRKREEFNREMEQARGDLRDQERRLEKREDTVDQKHHTLLKKERVLQHTERKLHERREHLDKRLHEAEARVQEQTQKLHEISGLNRDQAVTLLLERLDRELADEVAARIQRQEEYLRSTAEQKAREILASSIQRYAAEHTADTTVSTVDIPSDDMKGRIIGREGRNIRTFEKVTGVDVIVDDTPGVVIVSAFDNIRRETAKLALTKLIQDGRIHPSRIEEVVKETQEEMEKYVLEVGKQAGQEANAGPLPEKMLQLLGRLKFRTSYSQNVLQHSL
jgi:ribonucrease Y